MTLFDLKKDIIEETLDDDLLVFVCEKTRDKVAQANVKILMDQYIDKICQIKHSSINKINSLTETVTSALSLVFSYESYINVLRVEKFEEQLDSYSGFKNTIIVCDEIDKSLTKKLEEYTVVFQAPTDWQIADYINVYCPSLNPQTVANLCKAAKNDLFRIINELDKALLFEESKRDSLINYILNSRDSDLVIPIPAYELCENILNKNKAFVRDALYKRDYCDFQAVYLTSILIGTLKKECLIKHKSATAENLDMSAKQFNYLKNVKYKYSTPNIERNEKLLKFLASLDGKLKRGELDLSEYDQEDYIITRILSLI